MPPQTQRQQDEASGYHNTYGYTRDGDRIGNPNQGPLQGTFQNSNISNTPPKPTPPVTSSLTPTDNRYALPTASDAQATIASGVADIDKQKEINRIALMDAINQRYNTKRAEQTQLGEAELSRQRTMNLRSGTIDSPIGDTEVGKTMKSNKATLDAVEADRQQEITATLMDLDNVAYTRKRELTQDTYANAKNEVDMRKAQLEMDTAHKTDLKSKLAVLGKNRVTLDTFKKDPAYQSMVDAGLSDLEIESALNDGRGEQDKQKVMETYSQDAQGNAVLTRVAYDPITGQQTKTEQNLGVPYASLAEHKPQYRDGQYYDEVVNADGTITATPIGKLSEAQRLENEYKQSQIDENNATADKTRNEKNAVPQTSSVDENGNVVVSPVNTAAQDWVSQFNSGLMEINDIYTKIGSSKEAAPLRNEVARLVALQKGKRVYGIDDASIQAINSQIKNIDDLIADGKYKKITGNIQGGAGIFPDMWNTGKQDVLAVAKNLVSNQTLQALADAKSKGITFGALSEKELGVVAESASRISAKLKTNKAGEVTGFTGSESEFKKDLDAIKTGLQKSIAGKTQTGNAPAKQVIYQGKTYNVDANGDMTPA